MKKRLLAAAVAGAVMLSAGAQAQDSAAPEGYQLQQVLIMSRHNLRAPLASTSARPLAANCCFSAGMTAPVIAI
ncbi:TPA: hypothetical protein MYO13_001815 [Klebsiella variicola subsp. variicola]|nr:hypothetical protein [Klebsiella variicola subsp. variicola]